MTDAPSSLVAPLEDYRATHQLLNALYCHFQGWHTLQDILGEFKHEEGNAEELASVKALLDTIIEWREATRPSLEPILAASGKSSSPGILDQALDFLELLFEQLMDVGGMVDSILQKETDLSSRQDDVVYLVAAYSCMMYAFDNSVNGTIEFGEVFKDPELLDEGTAHREQAKESIDQVNWMYQALKDESFKDEATCEKLCDLCIELPHGIIKPEVLAMSKLLESLGRKPWTEEPETA